MKISRISILFTFLFIGFNYAQTPFFENYSLLRKNESVQVNAVFQDTKGFMWYGTNKGLIRFDGVKQKRFTAADHLPDNNVTAIAQDDNGKIWIGHKNGKLSTIENNSVKEFRPAEGTAASQVSAILFDKKGNLWFSTLGDGLYYFTRNRLYRLDETDKMPDLFIYDIAEDHDGNIWAGTDGGIAICKLHDRKATTRIINYDKGLPDNIIKKIVPLQDGTAWLGTDRAGIINYNPSTGKYKPLIKDKIDLESVTDFLFSGVKVWISSTQKGLLEYDLRTEQLRSLNMPTFSAQPVINDLLKDIEGNIWIGTMSGLVRTPGDYLQIIEPFDTIKEANIVALATDPSGAIWFSDSKGLYKRSVDKTGIIKTENILLETPYKNYSIISLFIDEAGFIWAGSYGEGALRINPLNKKISALKKQLSDGNILNITGKNNTIWLATLGGATQININGEELNIKNYTKDNGLASEYIYQVFIDSKNRTWFGTDGKGVDMLDASGFHHFNNGLNTKVIYGFAESNDHKIFINIQDEGLFLFNGSNFRPFNKNKYLHDSNINCLTTDKSGKLVMMHDFGIEIYDLTNNKISYLGEQSGIINQQSNLNAITKDLHGNIFFGTDKGIIIYADELKSGIVTPIPEIEGLKIRDQSIELCDDLQFSYDQNDITIHYLGIWFQNPDNLNFQYQLENYDHDWISSRNRAVTYSSLPPGNYTFRLKVSDSENFKNLNEKEFSFVILPPFWKTTWFYCLSIITCLLLAFTILKYRERKLQNDKRILETKNNELKKINMELDKFVYSVSHDLRAPLLSMQGVVEITAEITGEEITREHMDMLGSSITRLDTLIGDILDYSRNSRSGLNTETIDFKIFFENITNKLKSFDSTNKVEIIAEINDEGMFFTDRTRLEVVMYNLVSNAIRYHNPSAENPYVKVAIKANSNQLKIEISDNGIGIEERNCQKIFDMFYRVSETSIGSGLGLYIVKETVEKLNGNIAVKSQPGVGTVFTLEIPNSFYQ